MRDEHLLMWTVVSCIRAKAPAVSLAVPQKVKYRVATVAAPSLSHVRLFAASWTARCQASPSFPISWSLPMFMSNESVMPSNHLILCCPLLVLPSIFPSIRVFSTELVLCIRWPKYWSFSFRSVLPMNIQD